MLGMREIFGPSIVKPEHGRIGIEVVKKLPFKPNVGISIITSNNGRSCRHVELLRGIASYALYIYG